MRNQIVTLFLAFILVSCRTASRSAPTETANPEPSITFSPAPTLTIITTLTPIPERIEFSMISPDGTKIIQTTDWVTFDILNTMDKRVTGSFTYDRAKFEKGNGMFLGEAGYVPFYWSQNGKYIYIEAHQAWDGAVKYFGNVFGAESGIARFDVDAGKMIEILPETYSGFYTFAISPDGNSLVYTNQHENPLVLRWRDLSTNEEKALITFDKNILDVGAFGWSPKMDKLIFMTL
jgi:hypothetical protein